MADQLESLHFKKSTIIRFAVVLLFAFFWTSDLLALNCSYPNIDLNTQYQIDSFKANYDRGGTCDTISVDQQLHIISEDINNLEGCNSVEEILLSTSDDDQDGIQLGGDNCPDVANPDQLDTDTDGDGGGDGTGDVYDGYTIKDQQSGLVMKFTSFSDMEICRGVGLINGVILALVQREEYGCELWRIDSGGAHEIFADINAGEAGSDISYDFGYGPLLKGWYYFGAYDEVNKNRLWRTNGVNLERVQEDEPVPGGFEYQGISIFQAGFKGRNYFEAQPLGQERGFYSTDGKTMRAEPSTPPANNGRVTGYYTLFDKMIVTVNDAIYGHEPRIFNGVEYELLVDLVPGSHGSLTGYSRSLLWFYFDESWVFNARVVNELGQEPFAYVYTDGDRVIQLPHKGTSLLNEFNAMSAFIQTREFRYAVGSANPGSDTDGIPVLRISKDASSDYKLLTPPDKVSAGSGAILNNEAFVLANNRLFRLGETSAEELVFDLPSDWQGSVFRFVGSNAYFQHAYIKETSQQGDSRIWAWNHEDVGLLMADETHVVTDADYFRHIGNDIYIYGEDEINGWGLRRVTDAVIKPVPRLGAITGSWYDPETSGQGFVLHPVNDALTVFGFYGFENDGTPLWLTGVSEDRLETAHPSEFKMYINSGGNFGSFTPEQISEEEWGSMKITFDTCSKARAELDGISGQQAMNMGRLARLEGMECDHQTPPKPETAGITGSWYDPTTSGQGLILHSINDEKLVVSFYGYKNNTDRLWLIGAYSGQVKKGEQLVLDMLFTTGGSFGGFSPEDITETKWGTLTIEFDECKNATATLDGIDGQQTMNLVKLAGLQGSELNCH